jgi:hypothetical protein
MRGHRGNVTRRQLSSMSGQVLLLSSVAALGSAGCSEPTALDSFLARSDAEPSACVGWLFDRVIDEDEAESECWRVVGIDDLEAFAAELAVAVNDGAVPTDPDRSFCTNPGIVALEAVWGCQIEWGSNDQWFAVSVERDLYSTEWESLEATGEFPAETVSTIVVARSTVSLSPEGDS